MRFLKNYPAMKINEYLVIADLHLGITKDIYDRGIIMPRQSSILAERINKLKRKTRSKKLVILGDVKHKVPGFSIQEKIEIEKFFELLEFRNVIIVKGNHDGGIEKMVSGKAKVKKSFVVGDVLLTHGHRNVKTSKDTIIIGHNQPHVLFRDKLGAVYVEPVWVIGKLEEGKRLIIMPAFNELCGAGVINKNNLMGPIAKKMRKNAHAYLLDGTDIGSISQLPAEKFGKKRSFLRR